MVYGTPYVEVRCVCVIVVHKDGHLTMEYIDCILWNWTEGRRKRERGKGETDREIT